MGRTAYLFPGQGSQETGMGLPFAEVSAASAALFRRADAALGFSLTSLIREGPPETLALTEHTQPAVLTASVAAWQAATEAGLPAPDFLAGHSLGEYSALVAGGAMAFEDAVVAVRARGRFMQEAVPAGEGAMAAIVSLPIEKIDEACAEARESLPGRVVVPANLNGPGQTVIAGHADAVALAGERCLAKGARRSLPLDVSAPFHTPLMAPVVPRLVAVLSRLAFRDTDRPVVTNVEARPESAGDRLRELLARQVTAPVRWVETVAFLAAAGCDTFIELGPGSVLGGLVRRQLPAARVHSISHPSMIADVRAALAA